jgi:hypothetical protein
MASYPCSVRCNSLEGSSNLPSTSTSVIALHGTSSRPDGKTPSNNSLKPSSRSSISPASHRRRAGRAPHARRAGPPRPMRRRTLARTDRVAAKHPVAPRVGLPTGPAHPTRPDKRPRAAAAPARCDRTRPKPNRHAASHPCADSSVADTHRHRTHCKINYKRVGLHYTQLFAAHREAQNIRSRNKRLDLPPRPCRNPDPLEKNCSSKYLRKLG